MHSQSQREESQTDAVYIADKTTRENLCEKMYGASYRAVDFERSGIEANGRGG
jgi:hypothetical protein